MKKYLKLISRPTRWKCFGITLMALVGSILMSLGPVQLGKITTAIAVRELPSLGQLASAAALYGLISLVAEYISTARRVLLDCTIASHEKEIRANCIEKMLRMPISYYCDEPGQEGKLSGERTAQLNQGIAGLSQLMNSITLVKQHLNSALEVDGVVLTMFDSRSLIAKQIADEIRKFFTKSVFEIVVPRNVRLVEASSYGKPIMLHDPKCAGARAYKALTQEYLDRNLKKSK